MKPTIFRTAKKICAMAVLALAFLAWTSGPAQATTFAFDQTYFFDNTTMVTSSALANNSIEVAITAVTNPFSLAVTATDLTQADFKSQSGSFPNRLCLGYADNGDCLEYTVAPTPLTGATGPIQITISWLKNTNPTTASPLIIQAEGTAAFSSQLLNQTYFPCGGSFTTCPTDFDDPSDTGTTDNFSRFVESFTPSTVPEPATLVLLGSGLVGAVSRSRRRRQR